MRILADVHISPRTVDFLRSLGHDTVRVSDALTPEAADEETIAEAEQDRRIILTQDLDFSDIVALSRRTAPSVVSLRLASSRIETVNSRLEQMLPDRTHARRANRSRGLTDSHTQVAATVTSTSWPLDTAVPPIEVCLHRRLLKSSSADFLWRQLC